MAKRLTHFTLVLVLAVQGGFHWGLLQSSAWVIMYSDYVDEMSFTDAFNKTLDGKNPCAVCEFIEKSKEQSAERHSALKIQKLDLMLQSFCLVLTPPELFPLEYQAPPHPDTSCPTPEIPPPICG